MTQTTASLQFERPVANPTVSTELETEYRVVASNLTNEIKVQQYITLDPDNIAQEDSITITAGSAGDDYTVEVDDGTEVDTFTYIQGASDDANIIASKLAKRIDLHPGVTAGSANNVISLTAVVPGVAITYDVSSSSTPANLPVTNSQAAAGTAKHGMISETTLTYTVGDNKTPKVNCQTDWYDGNPSSATKLSSGGQLPSNGSKTLDAILTDNG